MDKYILVPKEKYDNMMKNSKVTKQTNKGISGEGDKDTIQVPPPGLPAADELAKDGIKVSEAEAEEINDRLIKFAYSRAKSAEAASDNTEEPGSWKAFWRSNTI